MLSDHVMMMMMLRSSTPAVTKRLGLCTKCQTWQYYLRRPTTARQRTIQTFEGFALFRRGR